MKGISDVLGGTRQAKSARGGQLRSAPKTKNSMYLELFTMNMERFRLNQEQASLGRRQSQIEAKMRRNQNRLNEIEGEIRSRAERILQEKALEPTVSPPEKKDNRKGWQTIAADY
jgi:hypothetical protein